MRCPTVQRLYDDYARCNLPPASLARIEEHLAQCGDCRAAYEAHDRVAGLLREATEVAHPGADYFDQLTANVLAGLERPESDPAAELAATGGDGVASRRGFWYAGASAAAALLALGFAGDPSVSPARPDALLATVPAQGTEVRLAANVQPQTAPTIARDSISPPDVQSQDAPATSMISPAAMSDIAAQTPAGSSPGARKSTLPSNEIRTVAARPVPMQPASGSDPLPMLLADRLEQMRLQMDSADEEAAVNEALRDMFRLIDDHGARRRGTEDLPAVRQVRLFADARQALKDNKPREAWALCRLVAQNDPASPLGLRAALQMADLHYSEWGDFAAAAALYKQCQGSGADRAFTAREREHAGRQLERLAAHSANDYEDLALQYQALHGDWEEAILALRRLVAAPSSEGLLPETARGLADRMQQGAEQSAPPVPFDAASEVFHLLDGATAAVRDPVVRAYLELALGDMQLVQFQQPDAATMRYGRAVAAAPDSAPGRLAQDKRKKVSERRLLDQLRQN